MNTLTFIHSSNLLALRAFHIEQRYGVDLKRWLALSIKVLVTLAAMMFAFDVFAQSNPPGTGASGAGTILGATMKGLCVFVKELNGPIVTLVACLLVVVGVIGLWRTQDQAILQFVLGVVIVVSLLTSVEGIMQTLFNRSLSAATANC
jgi:hypothetical protein